MGDKKLFSNAAQVFSSLFTDLAAAMLLSIFILPDFFDLTVKLFSSIVYLIIAIYLKTYDTATN